jgi:hypothetical protein
LRVLYHDGPAVLGNPAGYAFAHLHLHRTPEKFIRLVSKPIVFDRDDFQQAAL